MLEGAIGFGEEVKTFLEKLAALGSQLEVLSLSYLSHTHTHTHTHTDTHSLAHTLTHTLTHLPEAPRNHARVLEGVIGFGCVCGDAD